MATIVNVQSVLTEAKANGVEFFLNEGGKLSARGGDFTPQLRGRAKELREDIEAYLKRERLIREGQLAEAKASWLSFATPERGFFIGVLRNAVTERLEISLREVEEQFLNGTSDLKAVHTAFVDFAKASKRRRLVRQLVGRTFDAPFGSRKKTQAEIHAEFSQLEATGKSEQIARVYRTTVTPQIEPQPDQLERMKVYFGITPEQYADMRTAMEIDR